jgi:predicted nucleic acid-binding protein
MNFVIYLDVCCLNRPFDEQTQARIRLESESVLLILMQCQTRQWTMLGSEVITIEIAQTSDFDRKQQVLSLASVAATEIIVSESIELRASNLMEQGFKSFDALHLACAEAGNADIFLTTDDRLLRLAKRQSSTLRVKVDNPVHWLLEVTANGNS